MLKVQNVQLKQIKEQTQMMHRFNVPVAYDADSVRSGVHKDDMTILSQMDICAEDLQQKRGQPMFELPRIDSRNSKGYSTIEPKKQKIYRYASAERHPKYEVEEPSLRAKVVQERKNKFMRVDNILMEAKEFVTQH